MAVRRVSKLLLLVACASFIGTNAQDSTRRTTTTRSATTSAVASTTTATADLFSATIQSFPTAALTATIKSNWAAPSDTVQDFLPLFENRTTQSVSFTIDLKAKGSYRTLCWYPISGQYGLLPRILFYVTIVAALLLRHHQWLYAGALVSALTYSGAAAIHACLLVWRGPAFGELDMVALLAILSTSCLITVPLLNWSSTLRNIGKNENQITKERATVDKRDAEFDAVSRTIVLYWGFLVLVGFLCVFVAVMNFFWTESDPKWYSLTVPAGPSEFSCSPEGGVLDLMAGQSIESFGFRATEEFLTANRCTSPCLYGQFDSGRNALFRSDGDLQILDETRLLRFLGLGTDRQNKNLAFSAVYIAIGLMLLPYILLQGFWAAMFGRRTPAQARNVVYALLTRLRFSRKVSQLEPPPKFQRWAAKAVAMLSYLWAVFVLFLSVPVMILNFTAAELLLHVLPEEEPAQHVGAWSPWASTGIALFAVLFARYNEDIKYLFFVSIYKVAWIMVHPAWPYQQLRNFQKGEDGVILSKNLFTKEKESMPDHDLYRRATKKVVGATYGKSSNYMKDKILWSLRAIAGEWRQFREFWKNPDYSRANQGRVHRLEINDCRCLMKCYCQVEDECGHDELCKPYHICVHNPECNHTRACKRERRLRKLNPERVGVNMAFAAIHGHRLKLDITGKPIPVRDRGQTLLNPTVLYPVGSTDYQSVRSTESDDDVDEKPVREHQVPLPAWHDREIQPQHGNVSRMFSRNKGTKRSGSAATRGRVKHVGQSERLHQDDAVLTKTKSGGFIVSEYSVHPALRDSYVDSYHSRQPSGGYNLRPSIYSINEAELMQREKSLRKDLPPSPRMPRVPHASPEDSRSELSPVTTEGQNLSGVATRRSSDPSDPSADSEAPISDRPSPDSHPDSNPSTSTGIVSPQSVAPSPPLPVLQKRRSHPPPTHIAAQMRSSTNLTSSFQQSIISRQRRSTAYTPSADDSVDVQAASTYLSIPKPITTRPEPETSFSAPIPVHLETLTPFAEAPGDESYFSNGQTPSDLAASMAFSPDFADASQSPALQPPTSLSSPGVPPTPPPKNTPPQTIRRKTLPASLPSLDTATSPPPHVLPPSLQIRKHPTLPMPTNLSLPPIDLQPPSHKFSESQTENSSSSTPAITLPLLSPPDPASNTALAQNGQWPNLALRNPNMVTPAPLAGRASSGVMRDPLSVAGSRVQSLEGIREGEAEDGGAPRLSAMKGVETDLEDVSEVKSEGPASRDGKAVSVTVTPLGLERSRSPRQPGYRSTVSYLQVQRPSTMAFADEIVLRKDEFGVYRVVVNGEEVLE